MRSICVVAVMTLAALSLRSAEDPALKPEAGETALDKASADKVVATLAETFKANPTVRARMETAMDDGTGLAPPRKSSGELVMDRPQRLIRRFSKPAPTVWLLDGQRLHEYVPGLNTLFIKDFSQAPGKLKLIQAAVTMDVKALGELFDVHVFEKKIATGSGYRVLLTKKATVKSPMAYQHIQARINTGELFFHQIEYVPQDGDRTVETYSEIVSIPKPGDEVFKIETAAGTQRDEMTIEEDKN